MNRSRFTTHVSYLPEPLLEFAMGQKLVYPRDGLFLYGPVGDTATLRSINYGVIGTAEAVRRFHIWSSQIRGFIDVPPRGRASRLVEPQHVAFPGFEEAFGAAWPATASIVIDDIDSKELDRVLHIENRHEAVRKAVDLFVSPLVAANNRLENPPAVWFVVIPDFVYHLGRPLSTVRKIDRVQGSVTVTKRQARRLEVEPTLFGDEEREAEVYKYAPNFRRQLKARLLRDKIVTQILRETTLTPDEFKRDNGLPLRRLEGPATVAWNLATGTYYKAGGRPWQLANVRPGVCYVGLVYKRIELTSDQRYACCAAQMFLADGEGVVFRGALGPWFNGDTKQYHLSRDAARELISMVVGEYVREYKAAPKELFIHAKASFSNEEWDGFREGVSDGTNLVGVQIRETFDTKLFRSGNYPVIRGTVLNVAAQGAYLWTTGYTPRLDTYMGPETPNPIYVRVVRGMCPIETVLKDIMGLTKINFNSCVHHDHLPVTIKFADAVGDVLGAAPQDSEPRLPFKFYI